MRETYQIPRRRISLLFIGFVIFSLAIGYRVVSFQIVRSHELSEQVAAVRYREDIVPAQRGDIFDSRGRRLATNVPADRVSAIVGLIENPAQTAALLAPLIGRSAEDIEAALSQPDKEWVVLKRRLSPESSQQLAALNLSGIVLDPEPRRIYPMNSFASHILGFVNYDYIGSYGVEGAYDDLVSGEPGKLVGERDVAGNVIALGKSTWDPPEDGADIVLTIDSAVQWMIEEALDQAILAQRASGGTVIVQNPTTGEIIAMASRPSFDPNTFETVDDAAIFSNPAVSDTYEPGSTFKSLVMALGLETDSVTPGTVHNGGSFIIIPGGSRITNANGVDLGPQTMYDVLQHSSNLGAIFVAEQMGEDAFYRGLVSFGIGQPTGIDLEGESEGILPLPGDPNWSPANFYTSAFGQGLAVTPMQLVNAVSALANGGLLMEPYVVKEIHQGDEITYIGPQIVKRPISENTSDVITDMMVSVMDVSYHSFAIPGYDVAAKTGTAQIPSPDGTYEPDETIASIVGYGPAEDPHFTVLVKIDRPQESPWGEVAAGPTFQKIFQELFLLYGIAPSDPSELENYP